VDQLPAEELLKIEKEKLKIILSGISDAIITTDTNQNIIAFNIAAEQISGYRAGEVIGQKIDGFIKIFDGMSEIKCDEYCPTVPIKTDEIVFSRKNSRLTGKDGKESFVAITTRKITEATETNIGCIIAVKDVSKEEFLEQMKLDFVSLSAHELRTPLTAIRGFLSFLEKPETFGKLSDDEKQYLDNAIKQTDSLVMLIQDILIVADITEDKLKLSPMRTQLEELILSIVGEYKEAAARKGIELKFIPLPEPLPMVVIDISKTKDIFRHLLNNALSYTEIGNIKVSAAQKDDSFLEILVEDTGKGIPQAMLPHIFNKFFRVKNRPLVMEGTGRGLGLFITKKLVDLHGGTIRVESRVGEGTKVYFTLPIKENVTTLR